ncbi:MAG: DNA repair protein RecN, partial [Hyphococcus sp.]
PLLDENGLASTDEEQVILRRVIAADGRGRCFVNDQPVSVGLLRTVGETLLEIHGQHDGRGFLTASTHRSMLDEFGRLEPAAKKVSGLWRAWRDAEEALAEKKREHEAAAREAEYLRHVADTLDMLAPEEGEETRLAERRAELMAAEKIAEDLNAAAAAVEESGVSSKLSVSLRNLERAASRLSADTALLSEATQRLERALSETLEAEAAIGRAIDAFGDDPAELDQVEERLFALRAEARKHGVAPDGLAVFLEKTKSALDDVEQGAAAFAQQERAVKDSRTAFEKAAEALSRKRAAAAKKLDAAVAKELAPLKLDKAKFETRIESSPGQPTSDGYDRVEFMVTTNPGAPAGPLKTIASGGELSRFVLAMKAALAAKESRTVIIFDEVDAGIGGAVADAVGERLARLAQDAQVLVVTHSPQVAARADRQWRVEKTQSRSATKTKVAALTPEDRIEEIARMLSGASVTDEARSAARRLLGAPAKKPKRKLAKAG